MTRMLNSGKCKDIMWEGRADCKHCLIRHFDVLADLDVDKFEAQLRPIIHYCHPERSVLYNQGAPATDLYIIRTGLVKLEETLDDGSVRIVRLIQPGEIAGLETVLDQEQPYEQTAITVRETDLCRVPFRVFNAILEDDKRFFRAVMEQWHKQLEASDQVLVHFSTGNLRQRLTKVLLLLIEEAEQNNLIEFEMMHIDDIAALTGVTKESVSRIMAEFKRKKLLIKSSPNKLRFDKAGLLKIAANNRP